MAEYKDSTQVMNWLLDEATILSRRSAAHAAALSAREGVPPADVLSEGEETQLRKFHERRILRFIQAIQFPEKVAATAITYFKRFFVDQCVMDFNPAAIALSSLYAAFKVEEVIMSADDLVARFDVVMNGVEGNTDIAKVPLSRDGTCERVSSAVLLNTELAFLQQIKFHLICYHPFRSLGILREMLKNASILCDRDKEMADVSGKTTDGDKRLAEVMARAQYILCRRALLSDLSLSRGPAILAIAAIVVAAAEVENGPTAADIIDAIKRGSEAQIPVGDELVTNVTAAVEQMSILPDRTSEDEATVIAALEKKRRRVQPAHNFLTNCLKDEEDAMNLEQVDEEEAKRSRAAREKTAKLLGFDVGNSSGNDSMMKQVHEAADGIENIDTTPRKRLRLES